MPPILRASDAVVRDVLLGFVAGALLAAACLVAAGQTLGLFLGAMAMLCVALPPLALSRPGTLRRLLVAAALVDGIAIVWIVPALRGVITLAELLACYAILLALALALASFADAAAGLVGTLAASAIGTLLALLWLTWPIWLSRALVGQSGATAARWLVAPHPLFAINGALAHLGVWGEQRLAYRLTNLGQDVPYQLPRGILACVALHLVVAGIALLLVKNVGRSRLAVDDPDRQP